MKKLKIESRAKILYLKSKQKATRTVHASEIARMLFAERWRNYIDQVYMVAIQMKNGERNRIEKSKKPLSHSLNRLRM